MPPLPPFICCPATQMQKTGKWGKPLIIDEPIWDSVQSNHRGLCPNISPTKSSACPCCYTSDSPSVLLFFFHPHAKKKEKRDKLPPAQQDDVIIYEKYMKKVNMYSDIRTVKSSAVGRRNLSKSSVFVAENKGLRGVCRLGSWRLIECLEDKLGDIRYPSG